MSRQKEILAQVLSGAADANIRFSELRNLLFALGFEERVKGGHHILWRRGIAEIVNIQRVGSKAKPYQVKQVRQLILRYRLGDAL